jgi:hypothetical protein
MKRIVLVALLLLGIASIATADMVVNTNLGTNLAWFNGPAVAWPVDFEGGGSASTSLSPHISAVGSAWYGFVNSYARWDIGARITATDVHDPNFNVYLGIKYRGASKAEIGPSEWAPDAGFGWKPFPERWPRIIVGADAGYGLVSSNVISTLALRYSIPLK